MAHLSGAPLPGDPGSGASPAGCLLLQRIDDGRLWPWGEPPYGNVVWRPAHGGMDRRPDDSEVCSGFHGVPPSYLR